MSDVPSTAVAPAGSAAPRGMPEALLVPLLGLLLGLQPVTTDLYLPALPALTRALGAGMPQAQLTLTAVLLAFGLSQMAWGPLSDRFGRRRVLLAGLATHVAGSIGSALAPTIEALVAWRVLQGVGMGAGIMGARAVLRDLYAPADGARMMARALSLLGVLACLSPVVGGLVAEFGHWRLALAIPGLAGVAALAIVVLRFEETLPQPQAGALAPRSLARTWWGILRHPTFLAWCIQSAACYGALLSFLAASPFVFMEVLGVGRPAYGGMMASISLFYILGTLWCRRLLRRHGLRGAVARAAVLTLASGTALALLAWQGAITTPWHVLLPIYLFMLGHGVHQPCGHAGVVGPFPQAAGAASALSGLVMVLVAFAMGSWLGAHMDGTATPLAFAVTFWCLVAALNAWSLVQRHGEARSAATPPDPAHGRA